ncbi:hypothetical protein [Schlesneria paludicola]|uniref:hypothetical protein n=1 Tax=Schlesneria paludicola TaxID=360056 RepID=UPI00029A9BD7|nr:hypothetical protein [Schlesneria paludicola]
MTETQFVYRTGIASKNRLASAALVFQMLIIGITLSLTGRFNATMTDDSPGYLEFPFHSFDAALRDIRTPGYPSFLRLVTLATGSYEAAPTAQYFAFCGAILVFYFGLSRNVASGWSAAVIAGSLLTTNILWLYVQTITTDTLAAAAGIAAMGFILQSHGHEGRTGWALAGVIASTTAAWLIRPAYLFLVLVVPIVRTLLHLKHAPREELTYGRIAQYGVKSLTLACVPVFCWCLLRLCLVQSFGVVSFGGYNLVGIAGQFLGSEQVAQLPADLQPLARLALNYRDQLPANSLQMLDADKLNYLRIENNYDVTIWHVFTPAARELYGNDPSVMNTQLRKLATATLQSESRSYAVWLAKALRQGVYKIVSDFVLNPFGLMVTVIATSAAILRLARTWQRRVVHTPTTVAHVTEILFVMTFFYAVMNLVETILVCPPLGRMTDAAAVMLMPLATALMLQQFVVTQAFASRHDESLGQTKF